MPSPYLDVSYYVLDQSGYEQLQGHKKAEGKSQ